MLSEEASRVIKAATDLSGDVTKAISWYRTFPLQPFDGKTAEQAVADGKTEAVLRYIEMLTAGFSG